MKLSSMAGASAIGMFLAHPEMTLIEADSRVSTLSTLKTQRRYHANTPTRRQLFITALDRRAEQPLLGKERRDKEEGEEKEEEEKEEEEKKEEEEEKEEGEEEERDENNDSNNYQYDAEHPEEEEEELDCSQFTHLDDLPLFCQENQTEQGTYPVAGGTAEPTQEESGADTELGATTGDTVETTFVDNAIRVHLSLGVHLLEAITEPRSELLLWLVIKVASILLDRYSPFDVFAPNDGGDFMHMGTDALGFNGSNTSSYAGTYEDNGDPLLATLFYSSVATWESPHWDAWLQMSMEYVAYWPNGQPVVKPDILAQIEEASRQVINMTVDALKFWNELLKQDENGQYVLQDGYSWQQLDAPTIVAVAKIGDEYQLESLGYGKTEIDKNASDSRSYDDDRKVSMEPLSQEWNVREWFGLGLCISTIAIATLLTVLSSRMQRREATKRLWGLTEQGVGELLNVGWTYHQERNGQLFLKIFDKGGLGYSDDNSVLRGEVFAPVTAEVARTSATTASPSS